ncbi:hypothetical protein PoMZ_06767 [Pyricularia oryzae]|uniref:Uncharacterized protein n=1 Tax=Pyricularia oryzae TaxID=318829 RepID=A0A4P7NRL8_PYROR|nr:hypothetical protein PoMZ_06767 [Pyricularia oryzae]
MTEHSFDVAVGVLAVTTVEFTPRHEQADLYASEDEHCDAYAGVSVGNSAVCDVDWRLRSLSTASCSDAQTFHGSSPDARSSNDASVVTV